ncbi:MAG: exodeoxyribonuclease III [Lysobacteraceae bacterium]|nr:MAG: exodeoxyribonuclease III [Xanthomonadaceae bacterium]
MRIASWNVNSLNVRLPHLEKWLRRHEPDIVGLQETKLEDARFPDDDLLRLGYRSVFAGQKTYNGVALLAREAPRDVQIGIPGFDDAQRRVIAATIGTLRVVNLYVVNGKEVGDPKYAYKLRWLDAVRAWLADEIVRHPRMVVLGDFNIAPEDRDVHDPEAWRERILCSSAERAALGRLLELGLFDSFRQHHAESGRFSWWDYRAAAFRRNRGLRIDLVLLGEALRAACLAADIDPEPRGWERPSDHAPVWVELADEGP